MNIQLCNHRSRAAREGGYVALLTTLVLVGAAVLLMGSTLTRNLSNTRLNDRNATYISCEGAAEAAVEKVLARMIIDFDQFGEGQVQSNLTYYQTLLPTTSESPYWNNYIWSDAQGNDNHIYAARTSTNANAAFVGLSEQYAGLSGYSSTYRILANCRPASTPYNYKFTNAVQYDLQLAQIPIFQFAIFYNGLLEFSDCAPLTVDGTVHCNSNIYVGCLSSSSLTFNGIVTCVGNITDPTNMGYPPSDWTGPITYNGTPSPGYLTGQTTLTLPVGTNSTVGSAVQQILYPPASSGESPSSGIGSQRYYNEAEMTIWITNANNIATNPPSYIITLKSSASDGNAVTFTGACSTLTGASTNYFPWLTTTNALKDWRENKTMVMTQIDVAKLSNWMVTNIYVYNAASNINKFNSSNTPLNIIWVGDWRVTNATTNVAVRLINGTGLPTAGLTVATPNPLYVEGVYNAPNAANLNSTNVNGTAPASFACDALTILSSAWSDSKSFSGEGNQNANNDTVDAAILTGNVASTGNTSTNNSGGVHNLPRLQENWNGKTLTLNTSIVCLFSSTSATGQFLMPTTYYTPPTREFYFNQNYNYSTGMPPGTPNICRVIRASWCNPQPDNTNYYSQTLSFIPR